MKEDVPRKIKPSEKEHYVSNKEFYAAYVEWFKKIHDSRIAGKEDPQMPRYIAECILKICTRLAYRPNFFNYSFKNDMIGDAVENCVRVAKNFNAERSENPFSYITTIAFNAFLRRIEREKKESYVKGMLIRQMPIEELMDIPDSEDEDTKMYHEQYVEFLREHNYTATLEPKLPKKRKAKIDQPSDEVSLESFME